MTAITTTVVSEELTPLWDIIPGTAQLKSLVQMITGDVNGAQQTQIHYLNEGLGPAQARSAYFAVNGEFQKSIDIQKKFVKNLEGLLDGTPVLGHIKGGIHLLAGDHDHGLNALKSATSTTGTILGAAILGPIGAIGGHLITDSVITATDFALNGNKTQPFGYLNYLKNIGNKNAGEHFDALAGLVADGFVGSPIKTKTNSFNAPKTAKLSSDHTNELSKTMSYRSLLIADSEGSEFGERESSVQLEDSEPGEYDESVIQFLGHKLRKSPESQLESRIGSSDERVRTPDSQAESLDTKVKTPDSQVEPSLQVGIKIDEFHRSNNVIKTKQFLEFLQNDPTYSSFHLDRIFQKKLGKHNIVRMDGFGKIFELHKLDLNKFISHLDYLTDEEKSMVTKNDFRKVNIENVEADSTLSSLAGVLCEDVKTLKTWLSEKPKFSYDPKLDIPPKSYFKELAKRKIISYDSSVELSSLTELNEFLMDNANSLQNKKLILTETTGTEEINAVSLKIKKLKDNPNPAKLLIDYKTPGLLKTDVPNPFRVTTHIENPNSSFKVHVLEVLKKDLEIKRLFNEY